MNLDRAEWRSEYLPALLIAAAALAVMSPALLNGFVDWDDVQYVLANPALRGPWSGVFTFYSGYFHPLTALTYKLEFSLFGLHPLPYHLTNLLLHAVNCALLFRLFRALGAAMPAAFLGGLLFCLHPVQAEAAAWVSGRKELLWSFFALLSLISYLRYADGRGRRFLAASMLLFLLSLLSKPTAAIFPLMLPLVDLYRGRRYTAVLLAEKIPYLLAAAAAVLLSWTRPDSMMVSGHTAFSFAGALAVDLHALCFYIGKFLVPAGLMALYPAQALPLAAWAYIALAAAVAAAAVHAAILAARYSGGWNGRILFGAGLFLVCGIPGFVITPPADRYMYLPLAGLCLVYGESALILARAAARRLEIGPRLVAYAAALHLLLLAFLSFFRVPVWHDSMALWSSVLAANPAEPTAYYGRGSAYREAGLLPEAAADYTRCLEIEPGHWKALANRGRIYAEEKQFARALADYTSAIAINPASPQLYMNRGNAFSMAGQYAKAVADYDRVLELAPGLPQAEENRRRAAGLAGARK